jgi:uroporphyrinogen-III decarboxylase
MRQTGRYFTRFILLFDKYDFFTVVKLRVGCRNHRAISIRIAPDAILFSDILVIPQAMS